MRRTAGVRRDVAVAGRRAGRRARAAARAGTARRAATQVPRMLVLASRVLHVASASAAALRGASVVRGRSPRPPPPPHAPHSPHAHLPHAATLLPRAAPFAAYAQ